MTLPLKGEDESLAVPRAALIRDIHGGAWVYEKTGDHAYARRRVLVDRVVGDLAVLASGPKPGAKVVTDGAAELFGTEFGGSSELREPSRGRTAWRRSDRGRRPGALEPEQRVVLRDVGWEGYETMLEHRRATGATSGSPTTGETLELMSPSYDHERFKKLLGRLVEIGGRGTRDPLSRPGFDDLAEESSRTAASSRTSAIYLANLPRDRAAKDDSTWTSTRPPTWPSRSRSAAVRSDRMGIYAALGRARSLAVRRRDARASSSSRPTARMPTVERRARACRCFRSTRSSAGLAARDADRTTRRSSREWVRDGSGDWVRADARVAAREVRAIDPT